MIGIRVEVISSLLLDLLGVCQTSYRLHHVNESSEHAAVQQTFDFERSSKLASRLRFRLEVSDHVLEMAVAVMVVMVMMVTARMVVIIISIMMC